MSGFLYYVPGLTGQPDGQTIDRLGLRYAFRGDAATAAAVRRGPGDNGPGVVLSDPADERADRGYYADRQTWRRLAGSEIWVGANNEHWPGPADLARPNMLDGPSLTLRDGNRWQVPVARSCRRLLDCDEEGNLQYGDAVAEHAELWRVAQQFWSALSAADVAENDQDATVRFEFDFLPAALAVLGTNYRIGNVVEAVGLLRLFDDTTAHDIMVATIELDRWLAHLREKKSLADAGPTQPSWNAGNGSPAEIPISGPASQTS